MSDGRLDALLREYEDRKQEETQEQVRKALALEESRRKGAELLRRFVSDEAEHSVERLERAGHTVVYQEFFDHYPPGARIHVWPKSAPLDADPPGRVTLEFTWGEPQERKLCVRRWTTAGLGTSVDQGAAGRLELDELWVREQILDFVRVILSAG